MKINDYFLQTCMFWLTEISVYRYRINKMRDHLINYKTMANADAVSIRYTTLLQGVQIAVNKLNMTESRIVYILQEHTSWQLYSANTEAEFTMDSEEELFENMKLSYNLFIELQRSFNHWVQETPATEEAQKMFAQEVGILSSITAKGKELYLKNSKESGR